MKNIGCVALFIAGLFLIAYHYDYLPHFAERGPAATVPVYDFSGLSDPEFKDKMANRIVEGSETHFRSEGISISLGHATGPQQATAACDKYKTVEIVLWAEGMAVSGTPPSLSLTYPCRAETGDEKIQSLLIPFDEIYRKHPRNGPISVEGSDLKILAANMEKEWPIEWYVSSIKLQNPSDTDDFIYIDASSIRQKLGRNIAVHW